MEAREWIKGDESSKTMLKRILTERPYLNLPFPFHRIPLRVGNVIEITAAAASSKTHILMQSAIHCILPHSHFNGLGIFVVFFDLDCRFDVLRFSHLLKLRIRTTAQNSYNNDYDEDLLFEECMRRFFYIRCYDSLQFLAALKTLYYQLQREKEVQGINVSCMMIDSIGAFYWVDRASTSFHLGDTSRKGPSLQNVWETVVQEIKKLMLVHPMLIIATKATILGNRHATNDSKWNLKRPSSTSSAVSCVATNGKQHMPREYMPSVWQSYVTLRILVQAKDDRNSFDKNHNKTVYSSEWLLPSQSLVDNFIVEDAGVICVS